MVGEDNLAGLCIGVTGFIGFGRLLELAVEMPKGQTRGL